MIPLFIQLLTNFFLTKSIYKTFLTSGTSEFFTCIGPYKLLTFTFNYFTMLLEIFKDAVYTSPKS